MLKHPRKVKNKSYIRLVNFAGSPSLEAECPKDTLIFHFSLSTFHYVSVLSLDGSYAGEYLAFDGFEQGTTACADVAHLIGQAELCAARHAVATADE